MIQYSIEELYHFQCSVCKKWWTIGDFEIIGATVISCPFCNHHGFPIPLPIKEKEDDQQPLN